MPTVEFTYTPSTEDLDFFANGISDTSLTFILTNTDIPDGLTQRIAHRIQITNNSTTDHSGKTLTITGTDEEGKTLTETLAGPGVSGNVTTTGYYKAIENPTISATIGTDTFTFGFVDEFVAAPYPVNEAFPRTSLGITVIGTINYSVEHTLSQILRTAKANWKWFTVISGITISDFSSPTENVSAYRFKAHSYSAGVEVTFQILQPGDK